MTKNEMENRLRDLLAILMNGSREEFKQAKKDISSLSRRESELFTSSADIVFEFLPNFSLISKNDNKKAFISGLGMFFLHLGDDHFNELKDFTLQVVQHPNGHVREAITYSAEWLFVSLTSRTRPFVYGDVVLTEKQKTQQVEAKEQYLKYVDEIKFLLDRHQTEDDGSKYIEKMKPSVFKSLHQLLYRLVECPVYRDVVIARPVTLEIFMKRKELEKEILEMLNISKSEFTLEDVLDAIYSEEDAGDMSRIVSFFDNGINFSVLSDVIETIADAWNYFPHLSLDGLSPVEFNATRN